MVRAVRKSSFSSLEAGMMVQWMLPILKSPAKLQALFDARYLLDLAFDDSKGAKLPSIWLAYGNDHLLLGLGRGDCFELDIWLQVRSSDPYIKSLEGYTYKLKARHDQNGLLCLSIESAAGKKEANTHLIEGQIVDSNHTLWQLDRATLKGLEVKPGSHLEMALLWHANDVKQRQGWPISNLELLQADRQYWAHLYFQ